MKHKGLLNKNLLIEMFCMFSFVTHVDIGQEPAYIGKL
jgi:hypothetical protein